MECGRVSVWSAQANPHLIIDEILNFKKAVIVHVLHLFIEDIVQNFAFSVPVAKYSPFTCPGRMVGSSL